MSIIEIILVIIVMFWTIVFAVIGVYHLGTIVTEIMAVRKGAFKVRFRKPNNRTQTKLIVPDKESIKSGEKIYPFSNAAGYVYYEGNTPVIEYDINGNQINFMERITSTPLDPQGLNTLFFRIYNAGKAAAMKTDMMKALIIIAVVAAVASAALGFINMNTLNSIAAKTLLAA